MKNKFLFINCSSRKNGNCASLLKLAAKYMPDNFECETLNLYEYDISHCNGCLSCLMNRQGCIIEDSAVKVINKILSAKAIILASPIYFLSANSVLKVFLDRFIVINTLTDYQYKIPASIILTSGRPNWEGISLQMASLFLLSCGCEVKSYEIFHAQGPGEVFLDELISEKLTGLIEKTLSSHELLNPSHNCPVCLGDSFEIIAKKKVLCPICDISGNIIDYKDNKALIKFNENDLKDNRWTGKNLKEHMEEWVGGSIPKYKERIRDIIRRKRELLNKNNS